MKKRLLLIISISILITTSPIYATPIPPNIFDFIGNFDPNTLYLFIDVNGDRIWDWIISPGGDRDNVSIPFSTYPDLHYIGFNDFFIGWTFDCPKEINKVDEPATLFLMGSGLFVVGLLLRKKIIKPSVK